MTAEIPITNLKHKSADTKPIKVSALHGKVDALTNTLSNDPARLPLRPKAKRRRYLWWSFVICVLVPTLIGAYYYSFIASDRYVSGTGFAVRGLDTGGGADLFGAFTGLVNTGSTTSDSYIVLKYLQTRDLIERLQIDFDFVGAFSRLSIDYFSRLDPEEEIEEIVEYWQEVTTTTFDPTSGIITFDVEAFNPQDAETIASLVSLYTKNLVNQLLEQARQDTVRYAENEVIRAEARLRNALLDVRKFREDKQTINPAMSAQVQIEMMGSLEKEYLDIKARISALRDSLDETSPTMRALRRQANALRGQIEQKSKGVSSIDRMPENNPVLSELLAEYEALEVEKNFSEKAYSSALTSLENARVEADRQQRYLAVYSTARLAEYPLYPRRILSVFLVVLTALSIWGIGSLIVYSVRDHLS